MSNAYAVSVPWTLEPEHRLLLGALVAVEIAATLAYFVTTPATVTQVRYVVYPFVWINVGVLAVALVRTPPAGTKSRLFAATALAVGYFVLLMAVPGNIALGTGGPLDVRIGMAAPGWGPLVAVSGPVRLYLIPFEVVGYTALGYLVYANVLTLSRSVLSGAVGLATCVGCTVPVLVPLLGVLGGPTTGLASTAYAWSYDAGTALFVVTVLLLLRGARGT